MFISLVLLFITCLSLAFLEERLVDKDKKLLYAIMGVVMILIAGLRIPGATPDSDVYESMYYSKATLLVEPSFTLLSDLFLSMSLGVNALFITYAAISVPLRLNAISKLSSFPLLTLSIYISHYYMLHDVVEMRCAVASALFLLAVYYKLERRIAYSLLCILMGTLFHYSALVGLVIFAISNKPLKTWHYYALHFIIPIGIVFYFFDFDISQYVPAEIGGEKLQRYRELKENGMEGNMEGIPFFRDPAIMLNLILYYGCLFYHELLTDKYKYFPIFIKLLGLAFICKFTLGSLSSVVASRLFEYFDIVSIFLWTAAVYAFNPLDIGKYIISTASTIRFFFSSLIYVLGLGVNN